VENQKAQWMPQGLHHHLALEIQVHQVAVVAVVAVAVADPAVEVNLEVQLLRVQFLLLQWQKNQKVENHYHPPLLKLQKHNVWSLLLTKVQLLIHPQIIIQQVLKVNQINKPQVPMMKILLIDW
jgi:hypothetical protein